MLVSTLLTRINNALRGTDDLAPTVGSAEADYWLSIANQKKDEWARDPLNSWKWLFEERNLVATVASADNTYALDADFIRPSDRIKVTSGTTELYFDVIDPQTRYDNPSSVYISGQNPPVLNFNGQVTATTAWIGGTITVPGYYVPADMVLATDTVPVYDGNWLAMIVASEVAFNDTSYEDKSPDILGKANSLYQAMKLANVAGTATTPRKIRTSVSRIRGV